MPDARRIELTADARPSPIQIRVNGRETLCYPGETVATALLAAGIQGFRRSVRGTPRTPVCNMGVCYECMVTINGLEAQRSCMTVVSQGMCVEVSDEA
ncbi:(2Fe-2S)-binding protein [Pseudomonas sp.]|uniref:(2Fe-2S)-binding protein n=1 Tax=Pseudomonas sp. TaxID=306 RepID=UPI00261A4C96|nr:(2Fe-2S)-binding protein [Pseudomonas sp.]